MRKSKIPLSAKILVGLLIGIVLGLLCIQNGPLDKIFFSNTDMKSINLLQEYVKPI